MFNTNYFPKIRLKYLAFLAVYDKLEICKLLLDHFDCVFTTPEPSKTIHDPKTFFTEPPVSDASYLTDINFSKVLLLMLLKSYPLTQQQVQMVYQPHHLSTVLLKLHHY